MESVNIVVLDGQTLNPGDLSWEGLEALGRCTVHDFTTPDQTIPRAKDAGIVLTNKIELNAVVLARLEKLRYVGVLATGYNVVDVAAARGRNVIVTNVPTYATRSVAQMVFALLLELCHRVGHHHQTVRDGRWTASRDFCYWDFPLIELDKLTMGVVGFGRIGRATAELARAFGMSVLACDANLPPSAPEGVRFVGLDELLAESDVVSLHCPLTDETRSLIDAARLARMKKSAFLINTSRGPIVNEHDLADALDSGRIAGAGLDVLANEPPAADNPLLNAPNCYVTPHIAWATRAARARLMNTAVENVRAFLAGKPVNVVN